MGVKDRRQFSQEFKRNAVSMVMEKGIPVKKVASDLEPGKRWKENDLLLDRIHEIHPACNQQKTVRKSTWHIKLEISLSN